MKVLYVALVLSLSVSGCRGQLDFNSLPDAEILKNINPQDVPQVKDFIKECKATVGKRQWREIANSPVVVQNCISRFMRMETVKMEVEDSIKSGDLDVIFKKYCGRRDQIVGCVDDALKNLDPCLNDGQKEALNKTRLALDKGIDFACHNNGDRIALFLAEKGDECVQNRTSDIKECVYDKVPEIKEAVDDVNSFKIDDILISKENCKKIFAIRDCIVKITEECEDSTPANVLESLIKQALSATPCVQTSSANSPFINSSSPLMLFVSHFLTFLMAALAAIHILL